MNYKKVFYKILNDMQNKELKLFCKYLADHIPSYFWSVPATSSGKYHPDFAKEEEGLVKHSLMVYRVVIDLIENNLLPIDVDREVLMCAALFHDCCKRGKENEPTAHTLFNHPIIASNFIYEIWLTCGKGIECTNVYDQMCDMCRLIESHMGKWNTNKYEECANLPTPQTTGEILLHNADYIASRVYCKFDDEFFKEIGE